MTKEERDILLDCMASLAAAISLLKQSRREKIPAALCAASNRMFDQMIKDYDKALDNARRYFKE